jgi:hypothetical protein
MLRERMVAHTIRHLLLVGLLRRLTAPRLGPRRDVEQRNPAYRALQGAAFGPPLSFRDVCAPGKLAASPRRGTRNDAGAEARSSRVVPD